MGAVLKAVGSGFILFLSILQTWPQSGTVEPVLDLEKQRYVLGESVRFWVGVKPQGSAPVSADLEGSCILKITDPNGTQEEHTLGAPVDGPRGYGWRGGMGLGSSNVHAGTYHISVECPGGTKTDYITIENDGILAQIRAEFHFERSGNIETGDSVPVVLSVQNNSPYLIRFPQRGAMMEGVSLRVERDRPAYSLSTFYPSEKLASSSLSPDTYTWDVAPEIPSVTLKPGEQFKQRFLLEDAYKFDLTGKYEVGFLTVLPILVGEKNGPYAQFCPIRVLVSTSARFNVKGKN